MVEFSAWPRAVRAAMLKNWRLSVTYPTWLLNRMLSPLVWILLAVYAYAGIADGETISRAFKGAGEAGSFTSFLILGQTVFSFFTGLNWRGGMAIQRERWFGTLEMVLLAPTSRVAFVLGESLYGLLDSGWTVFLAMVLAFMLFGADLHVAHPGVALVAVALTLAAMTALGVFFAGFYMLSRAAAPLSHAIQAPVRFLSGAQFPLRALPGGVAYASYAIPVTYGMLTVRASLLAGAGFAELWPMLAVLAASTVAFLAAGAWLIGRFETVAKERGTLHAY